MYTLSDDIYTLSDLGSAVTEVKGGGYVNPLTPNDPYRGRTAPLTSKCCILYNYSTNIGTE